MLGEADDRMAESCGIANFAVKMTVSDEFLDL